ncbi:hypothetical protein K469DRAFT_276626 [Zopfia rhizophila CBS 207.26]|uniref:BTB domain-containing protein n=1 Tax=Zopfia rhizophila CBS 207.26 TaxID=1314779 RepID=A0A6A6DSJ5_9PEZI|nr:hypothetical protein K469DRAFT_276626 [Zopfia rhizophila CBS 207.26]
MADSDAQATLIEETPSAGDVEMTEGGGDAGAGAGEESGLADIEPETPKITVFLDLIKSPVVDIVVGTGNEQTTISAHQAVLVKSPYFEEKCSSFAGGSHSQIILSDADVDAMGSVVEYLYTGEYFPKRLSAAKDSPLENDPRIPKPDTEGVALLVHARIYTLADRFGLPALKSLAHSKIHRTSSTAKGEISYARYVYKETSPEDTTIRRPVAAFWATRSYTLRHDAEVEFKAMCLEFPQFSYDVLKLVLDQQEKSKKASHGDDTPHRGGPSVVPGSARKRARVSQG